MMDKKQLKKHFDKPSSMDRSAPFWSWNGKMSVSEVKSQAHDMHLKGMGGFFMHSRVGLDTEYMSTEWLDAIKGACEQAKEDGTLAWLYDEDRWPSGGAGGIVCNSDVDNASKGMTIRINDESFTGVVKKYIATIKDKQLLALRNDDNQMKENEVLLVLGYDYTLPLEWFNDTPGVDNINKQAVKTFIDCTYEVYKEEVGQSFGKEIPGIFTDEPSIDSSIREYDKNDLGRLPWTKELGEFFLRKRGYDFYSLAPYLFFNGKHSKKIRHDYFRTLGEMFATNFTKQIYDWCDNNNLLFTGHFLAENRLGSYILLSGSVMPNYMYEHIPGIDMLGEKCNEFMTIKKCTSVGNQMGRERMMSETYGVSGWEFTFEGQKWIGDYQFVLGINLRCQHLTWYSMRGCRKRDYPPLFNYQTTWWEHNNLVEDYFARISAITSKGKVIRDVLVIHPVSTAWTKMDFDRDDKRLFNIQLEVDKLGYDLNDFTKFILGQHYDFDYGDEDIIEQLGNVDSGQFVIGQASYKLVVIPKGTETLYQSTVDKLLVFMEQGGTVICIGQPPTYIEANEDNLIKTLIAHKQLVVVKDNKQLISLMDDVLGRTVSIVNKQDYEQEQLMYMLREQGDCQSLFVINNDRYVGYDVTITLKGSAVEEWDLLTGEVNQVKYEVQGENVKIKVDFGPCDSKMYMITKDAMDPIISEEKPYEVLKYLGPECAFTRCDPNALVLDMCRYSINNEPLSAEQEIWIHQETFREKMGMTSIKHNRGVQRYKWIYKDHKNNKTPLKLNYQFTCIDEPSNTYLVVERISEFSSVTLNGQEVPIIVDDWYMDKSFGKILLPNIKQGSNELVLTCDYTHDMELENIYIIGDFAINMQRQIVKEPKHMHFGDWAMQGYLFYPGSMIYHFEYEYDGESSQVMIDVPSFSASVMEVYVNEKKADYIPWKAKSQVMINELLRKGNNQISIKLIGTPRNLFGPFHFANCDNKYHSSYVFAPDDFEYTSDYKTHPYGLFNQVYIYGK